MGHGGQKLDLLCILNHSFVVLINAFCNYIHLINQLRSDYFGNLSRVENVVDYLFVIDQCQFLLHICILVGVMFHLLRDRI